jgi:hypothetical protein
MARDPARFLEPPTARERAARGLPPGEAVTGEGPLMTTSWRDHDGVRKLGDRPTIPRGKATLPPLPSLQTPLPVLSSDPPKAKTKASGDKK